MKSKLVFQFRKKETNLKKLIIFWKTIFQSLFSKIQKKKSIFFKAETNMPKTSRSFPYFAKL
jgi:hypothetical protein